MPAMLMRAGVLIEADRDEEMPEQMLSAVYLTHLDSARCATLRPETAAYLLDPRNRIEPLSRVASKSPEKVAPPA